MPDETPEAAIEQWDRIVIAAESNGLIRTVVGLANEVHADVSVTLRLADDDGYLTVSFGHLDQDDEED